MKWIKKLLQAGSPEPIESYSLLCSGCRRPCSGDDAHVIPRWNHDRINFLKTYRCGLCWHHALDETRTIIKELDSQMCEKFCKFLERHGHAGDAELIRQASLAEASQMIGMVLDAIESEAIRLSP